LFAHRRWIRRTEPFPHVYAREVFTEEFYGRLRAEVARVRTTGGTGDTASPGATAGREHTAISLWELRDGPLALFTSREWHDLIAGLAEAVLPGGGAGAVTGTLRHHPVGGQAGETRHEPTGAAGALALLFHLGPAEWRAGDGGETALYPVAGDAAPALVPPLGNSLVLFATAPHTRHRHLGGDRHARDSVLMYLHDPDPHPQHRTEGDTHGRG